MALPQPVRVTDAVPTIVLRTETGYSIMSTLAPSWGGSNQQVQELANLTYSDGTAIITPERRDIIRNVMGMLMSLPYNDVLLFLQSVQSPEDIIWNQPALDVGKDAVLRELTILQTEEVGVKGVGKCRYCPSTELVYATKQLRSGDEPATIFVRCVMCQKQWKG